MSKKKLLIIIASIATVLVATIVTFIITNNKSNEKITYEVTFDSNGGNVVEKQIINKGDKANKPNDPIKEGYLFVEWLYNNETFNFDIKIEKDINLIAKWQEVEENIEMVTIKFDSVGGSTISNHIIEKGTKVIKPENPTKEDYIFKGWYLNEVEFNFETSITNDIELKAKWEEKPVENKEPNKPVEKNYTVTFNTNGGNSIKSQTIKEGAKATRPSNPTKQNYVFINWLLDGKEYNFDTKITKNITLVANYGLLGDVNNDKTINSKDTTLLMRYLSSYNVEISKINSNVNTDNVIDEIDIAIIRKLSAGEKLKLPYNSGVKYTINYNLNGGIFDAYNYIYKKYSAISLPYTLSVPKREGYVFIGWTGSNGNTPQKNIEISKGTTGNLEYNANWLLYGDVNNDNTINSKDTSLILQYISGKETFTNVQKEAADVNLDSKINDNDIDIIRKFISGDYGINKLPYTS